MAGHRLDAESVEHGAEHPVVVEAGGQVGVEHRLLGLVPVDDPLVEVGGPDAPDAAGEHDVGAVVHLGQVVEGAGLLRVREHVGTAPVGDLDEALFDVDVGSAVLTHRPQLDQVDVAVLLGDGVEEVEGAGHIVDLRVDRVLAVDHRIGRRPLLGEVDHGLGLERGECLAHEGRIGQVPHEDVDVEIGDLLPTSDAALQAHDGDEAVDPHLEVVATTGEVVHDAHTVTTSGQVERRGPTQIAVPPEYQNIHVSSPSRSSMLCVGHAADRRRSDMPAMFLSPTDLGENCELPTQLQNVSNRSLPTSRSG